MVIKIGLIGAGGFGTIHLQGYAKNPNCEVIAIASRTKSHALKAAREFSIKNIYFGDNDWKKLILSEDLDAVSICTPNYLHAPMALEALNNGIHVLCEKPICINRKELEELAQANKKSTLIFMTSFQKRFNPIIPILKSILDNEVLGRLILVKYYFSHYGPYTSWKALSEEKWFFNSSMAGGGVLLDLGVHCIDILRHLIGEYKQVDGVHSNISCIDMRDEDNCNVLLRFQNDTLGMISVSWCNFPSEVIEIYGSNGNLRIDLHSKRPVSFQPKSLKKNKLIKKAFSMKNQSNHYQDSVINQFINAIITNKQTHPNFDDGKKAVEFVFESYDLLQK
jgi:UDP-N-acetylglucosamine 3-dehydrogenase